jgi:hypothetical protein
MGLLRALRGGKFVKGGQDPRSATSASPEVSGSTAAARCSYRLALYWRKGCADEHALTFEQVIVGT